MDTQSIRAFLMMQMEVMERDASMVQSGQIMLAMADYLLEWVQKNPDAFQTDDMAALRRTFLRCGSAGDRLRSFYDHYHEPLELECGRIMEKIRQNTSQIKEKQEQMHNLEIHIEKTKEQAEQLRKENQQLLEREDELKQRQQDLEKWKARIELCEQIQQAGEDYEEWKAYLGENERLEQGLLREGFFDTESFLTYLKDLKRQSEELTSRYDRALQDVLEDARNIQEKIRKRQKAV